VSGREEGVILTVRLEALGAFVVLYLVAVRLSEHT
jgi:hypothetical protein